MEELYEYARSIKGIMKEEANPSINICGLTKELVENSHSVLLDANPYMAACVVCEAKEYDETIKLISYWNFNPEECLIEGKTPVESSTHREMMEILKEVANQNLIRSHYGLPVFNFRITHLGSSPAGDLITFYPRIIDDADYWETSDKVRSTIRREIDLNVKNQSKI